MAMKLLQPCALTQSEGPRLLTTLASTMRRVLSELKLHLGTESDFCYSYSQ